MYAHSHSNRGSKWTDKSPKKQSNVAKKRSSRGFISEMKVTCVSNFLFDILTIYFKYHLFQFSSRGIRMQIPILTGVQNELESHRKDSVFFATKCSF